MEAFHAEKNNKEAISKHILSSYAEKLEGIDKRRYIDKISVIGMDPLEIPLQKFATECRLPPVEACDILLYLVLETSFYTKEQFQNFQNFAFLQSHCVRIYFQCSWTSNSRKIRRYNYCES